jgi:hypothetical protein
VRALILRNPHLANSEQIEVLNQGVEAWNKWWDENDEIELDLCGADLGGVNIEDLGPSIDLNFYGANLSKGSRNH